MHWIQRFDLFLLDLDGLLVDTEHLHFNAYQKLFEQYGQHLTWSFEKYIGIAHTGSDGLRLAMHPYLESFQSNWSLLYDQKTENFMNLLRNGEIRLMPGVETFLEELSSARAKRCVVTNSTKAQVAAIQTALPVLRTIPLWITREDYDKPKPAPDGYLKALELLADPKDRVIGFEDSLKGIDALRSASVEPVLICDANHPQIKHLSFLDLPRFDSFLQIPKAFMKQER